MDKNLALNYIIGEDQINDLIETMQMLEDKIENSHDRVAQEYYDDICATIYQMCKAVNEAKTFYN